MAGGPIIIYLNWLSNRQAVSVRPVGLSCVEAVKDWVSSLRQSSEPFEIAGLKSLTSGQTIWADPLPDNLGPGIPQHLLVPGADYEVVIGAPKTHPASGPSLAAVPQYNTINPVVAPSPRTAAQAPALPQADFSQLHLSPGGRIYPVAHPFRSQLPFGSVPFNADYQDLYENHFQAPNSPRSKVRSESAASLVSKSQRGDRLSSKERILAPKADYGRDPEEEGFDPNLRTVYRKMSPEDLDNFVYRMYAPYKHSAPRRDIYDEKKELEKRSYAFRDEIPANKPPMDFRKEPRYEDDEDDEWVDHEPLRMSEAEIEAAHLRLYEAAQRQREKQNRVEESRQKVEAAPPPTCSRKLNAEELKAMKERLTKPRRPPPQDEGPRIIGSNPVKKDDMEKNIERWTKIPPHSQGPEMPGACEKKKIKVSYDSYKKLMEKLMTPNEREREWRKHNPVQLGAKRMEEEKKAKGERPPEWKGIW